MLSPSLVPDGWLDHTDQARASIIVTGPSGRPLAEVVSAAEYPEAFAPWDRADYDMVATLRAIVLAVGVPVLGLGLLGFAVAAIDRAMQRRREAVALQLVGVPGAVLRRVQWIESAVAALTVLAANPRIAPDTIRRE
ncbi:MAG: hypothetical protein ACK5OX_09605 [Desertimonas sp.]